MRAPLSRKPLDGPLLRTVALAGLLSFSMSSCGPVAPPEPVRADHLPFAGCYQLTVGQWRPALSLGEDAQFVVLPSALELQPARGTTGWEQEGYILRVPSWGRSGFLSTGYWYPIGGRRIFARLTDGFTSLGFFLRLGDGDLRGFVKTGWDFPRTPQRSEVSAQRQPCAERGPGDSQPRAIR
jgi:hypothetical protein